MGTSGSKHGDKKAKHTGRQGKEPDPRRTPDSSGNTNNDGQSTSEKPASEMPDEASAVSSHKSTQSTSDNPSRKLVNDKPEVSAVNQGADEKTDAEKVAGTTGSDDDMSSIGYPSIARITSMEPKDIMISYSHQDKDQMRKIRDGLEAAGITVWVDEVGLKAGVEFFNKIGQAIVDAKLFLSLLSPRSVVSKYCKDELALAYVSSKPIFPCALEQRDDIIPLMDFGMRLQLAPVTWIMFTEGVPFNQSILDLVQNIKTKLAMLDIDKVDKAPSDKKSKFQRQRSHINLHSTPSFQAKEAREFWDQNFEGLDSIDWETFESAFYKDYQKDLDDMFQKVDQSWLLGILSNELDEDGDGIVTLQHYNDFCTVNGEQFEFWLRVQEQALESYTMREVFSMDSTVRIDAIQNLSKFHSSSVLEALLDLCHDRDENVRAVAALSLARVAQPQNKYAVTRMMNLLKDKDRLVRESGCLALGHIKAEEAAPQLVNLWRNDAISNVREAAQIALEQIGGEEASKAMHITKVLSEEIKKLAEKP